MSQHNLHVIIRQQQKQLVAMQTQIQALIAGGAVAGRGALEESNTGPNMEIAKPPVFNGKVRRVEGFITAYRLYLRMKMREATVEEQVQWILLHVQRGSVDVWKENVLEDLEAEELEYKLAGEFLAGLKREFGGGDKEAIKVTELKRIEQGGKIMEEFVQEFKRVRGSRYKGRPLVEEFKRGMSGAIRRKLMEAERPPTSIEQWYECATNLDRHWRESKREEERIRG